MRAWRRRREMRKLVRDADRTFADTRAMLVRFDYPAEAIENHDRMVAGWRRITGRP